MRNRFLALGILLGLISAAVLVGVVGGSTILPSSRTPEQVTSAHGDPGVSSEYSRGDHRHQIDAELLADGGGLHYRNPADIFRGTSRAVAEAARDAHFQTHLDLVQFIQERSLGIILRVPGQSDVSQTWIGQLGAPYDGENWVDRTAAGGTAIPDGTSEDDELRWDTTSQAWRLVTPTPVPGPIYVGWTVSSTGDISSTEIATAGSSSAGGSSATLPTVTANQHMWVWMPSTRGSDASFIAIDGSNDRAGMQSPQDMSISGVPGRVFVSFNPLLASLLSGSVITIALFR